MAIYREDLDSQSCPCGAKDCDALYARGACCGIRSVEAKYVKSEGVLMLSCPKCGAPVAEINIASRHDRKKPN